MPKFSYNPQIIQLVERSSSAVARAEILSALDIKDQTATQCLGRLIKQKKLRSIGKGRYTRYIALGPKGDAAWAAYIEPKVLDRIEKAKKPLSLANLCESIDAPNLVVHQAVTNLRKKGVIARRGTEPNYRYMTLAADRAARNKAKGNGEPPEQIEYRPYKFATGESGWEWLLRDRGTVVAQCAHLDKTVAIQAAEDYLRKRQEILKPVRQGGKDYGDYRR